MKKIKICFASNNPNKLHEIRQKLGDTFDIVSLEDIGCTEDIEETEATIAGNSRLKADYIWKKYSISCFADDTGLEVEALGGAPGVKSARYAGEPADSQKNIDKLLAAMEGKEQRDAQFRTVITLILDGEVQQFEGCVKGTILSQRTGEGGFGYDPVFMPLGYTESFAQMPLAEKNQISHRALAVEKLVSFLQK